MEPAYSGGLLWLNGWDYPCVVDVDTVRAAAPLIPARIGHGQTEADVLGQISVEISNGAVNARGKVTNRESPNPRAVLSMASNGHQFQASIGGDPPHRDFVPAGREIEINGRTVQGPCYACYGVVLGEISVVSLGADSTTATYIAAEADPGAIPLKAHGECTPPRRGPKRAMDDYWRASMTWPAGEPPTISRRLFSPPTAAGATSPSTIFARFTFPPRGRPWLGAKGKPDDRTFPPTCARLKRRLPRGRTSPLPFFRSLFHHRGREPQRRIFDECL